MKTVITGLIWLALIALLPFLAMNAYMMMNDVVVNGVVIGKQEALVMSSGDTWKHVHQVTYRYKPQDEPYPVEGIHRVDPELYRRLQAGAVVSIRYSPSRPLRLVPAVGSFIEGSATLSRLPYGPPDNRSLLEMVAFALGILVAYVAYRRRSMLLGVSRRDLVFGEYSRLTPSWFRADIAAELLLGLAPQSRKGLWLGFARNVRILRHSRLFTNPAAEPNADWRCSTGRGHCPHGENCGRDMVHRK